jgi:hypothetical protein
MTVGHRRIWTPYPTPIQLRLLHLVLSAELDPDDLLSWTKAVSGQRLDQGSRSLLPSLYLRLEAEGLDHPWLAAMQRMHRRTFYRNRLLIHRALGAVSALAAKGISALLLKGAAIGPGYYTDLGARAMGDVDIMVPEGTPPVAVERLLRGELGMKLRNRALHAHTYLDGAGFEYDIHWYLLPELAFAGSTRSFWESAEPIELEGQSCRTLCPEDHVFHLLVHGLRISDVSPLRWIVDTVTVLRRSPGFDWQRLVQQASRTAVVTPVVRGLSFLMGECFLSGDAADTLAAVEALAERWQDRYIFAGQMREPSLVYSASRPFLLYSRLQRLGGKGCQSSFSGFLAALWDLESPRKIPRAALEKLGAKLGAFEPFGHQ